MKRLLSASRALRDQTGFRAGAFCRKCRALDAGRFCRRLARIRVTLASRLACIAAPRTFAAPLWLGKESLDGKTILLHAEQGLGDTIQFARYAPLLAARGAKVILEVQQPLRAALSRLPGAAVVIARGETPPRYDFHCPLLSLPLACGTTLETIPADHSVYRAGRCRRCIMARAPAAAAAAYRTGVVWRALARQRSQSLDAS